MPEQKGKNEFKELSANEIEQSTVFSKPNITDKKPPKENKHLLIKTVISVAVVLALVASVVFINKNFGKKQGSSTSLAASSAISDAASDKDINYAVKIDTAKVTSVTIKNENGELDFYKKASGSDEALWYIKGLSEKLCDTETAETVVKECAEVAVLFSRDAENGVDYGFKNPAATVTVKHKDGTLIYTVGKAFKNGNMTGAYIKISGKENRVYIMQSEQAADYSASVLKYIKKSAFTAVAKIDSNKAYFDSDDALDKFDYIEYSGNMVPKGTVRIEMYGRNNSTQKYKMTKPYTINLDADKITDAVSLLKNDLTVSDIYYYNKNGISEKVLASYGLDAPAATVNYAVANKTYSIKLAQSKADKFYYSVIVNDDPVIYKVPKKTFAFLELVPYQMATGTVVLENIDGLKNITLNADGKTYKFDLKTVTKDDEDTVTVKYDGKKLDSDNFTNYYYYIMAISPYLSEKSLITKRPDTAKEYFKLTFTTTDKMGDRDMTVTVFKTDINNRYYIEVDNNPVGLCETTYADMVYNNIDNLISGVTLKAIS